MRQAARRSRVRRAYVAALYELACGRLCCKKVFLSLSALAKAEIDSRQGPFKDQDLIDAAAQDEILSVTRSISRRIAFCQQNRHTAAVLVHRGF